MEKLKFNRYGRSWYNNKDYHHNFNFRLYYDVRQDNRSFYLILKL